MSAFAVFSVPRDPVRSRHLLTLEEVDANPWCSCGPAALAALLGRPLAELRKSFPNQREGRTWTNARQMADAMNSLCERWTEIVDDEQKPTWPSRGLVMVEFGGSWSAMPVNHPARLQRTHWIAVAPLLSMAAPPIADTPMVFDVNGLLVDVLVPAGGWQPRETWERLLAPILAEGYGKKATGEWWVRAGIEVAP